VTHWKGITFHIGLSKLKFLRQGFQARTGQTDRQTDRRDRTHYQAAFADGSNVIQTFCKTHNVVNRK